MNVNIVLILNCEFKWNGIFGVFVVWGGYGCRVYREFLDVSGELLIAKW